MRFALKGQTVLEHTADMRRSIALSSTPEVGFGRDLRPHSRDTQLIKDYHRIEKGLAMPAPKRPFGSALEHRIDGLLDPASMDDDLVRNVTSARAALSRWNDEGVVDEEIAPLGPELRALDREAVEAFVFSRHSVRNFDRSRPVPHEILDHAAELAMTSPSVCNRRAGRIHLYCEDELVEHILRLQRGNMGFGQTVGQLAVVTVNSTLFAGAGERNQKWIDGALVAMSFVWALHAHGVGACMLNWSKSNAMSARLREVADIPVREDIICVIALGYPAAGYRVARSPRRPTAETIRHHD
ncbi:MULTISPECIES: nitroreductase family protein [Micrococcus]|nr:MULTISPECIES: nitroreductase family protein [Micrococcus]OFR90820.1 hypothetical protein HMPREF2863_06260 [Micrococcus sp. HMSC067E09]